MIQLLYHPTLFKGGFPGGTRGKEPTCQCRRRKKRRFDPWIGKIPWSFSVITLVSVVGTTRVTVRFVLQNLEMK